MTISTAEEDHEIEQIAPENKKRALPYFFFSFMCLQLLIGHHEITSRLLLECNRFLLPSQMCLTVNVTVGNVFILSPPTGSDLTLGHSE